MEKYNNLTAEKYDRYASQFPLYDKTADFLVNFAQISAGEVVVDLGCGTGV